jgi:hypothetical protein
MRNHDEPRSCISIQHHNMCLARSQRTPSLASVARMVWPLTCLSVMPSSKLTSAAIASLQKMLSLSQLSPDRADVLFLRLMIAHHEAAIPMAQAILMRTDEPEVRVSSPRP